MKGRKQKISNDTRPQKNRAELEGYMEGQTFMWITENNYTDISQSENGLLGYNPFPLQSECSLFTGETQQRSRWYR